ncbi:MAG: filamentous hemagglutinin N-terminal domain-containing protein, partial [Rhodobacterales bacterium]|nr:filamentous hemagglutinin N-terminal domain-containing protein [Rhodobacterales bacterium]
MVRMTHGSAFRAISASDRRGLWRLGLLTLVVLTFLHPDITRADDVLPQGGSVAQGNAAISTPAAGHMVIDQSSDRAVVNWDGFSIGHGNSVDIRQRATSSAILNRVTGDTTSQIHGRLSATGQVFVVNPNGIFIGQGGAVSAGGGFVASTLDTTDENFMAGRLRFEGDGRSKPVQNAGRVTIGRGGFAALMGGRVTNSGSVTVPMGRIGLAAGEMVTLDVSGDGFLQVAVPSQGDSDEMRALIENSGTVSAMGGLIEMQAATARDAARNAINLSGVAEARSVSRRGGTIVLGGGEGGAVRVTGRVTTRPATAIHKSLRPQARRGGDITITGRAITLEGAQIAADGDADGGRIHIGGAFQGGNALPSADSLSVDAGTRITADAGTAGEGGRVVLWSDRDTTFRGTVSARGGATGGDGGFVEVSGKQRLAFDGRVDTSAPQGATGTLLLDPHNVTIAREDSTGIEKEGSEFTPFLDDAILPVDILERNLAATNITVLTNPDLTGTQEGNITVADAINWTSSNTLTFRADNDVILNAGVTGRNGAFLIGAGRDITTGPGGAVDVGRFLLAQGDWVQNGAPLPGFTAGDFDVATAGDTSFLRAAGGDGSVADPYQLVDIYGVQGIGSLPLLDQNFALANDIDAAGTAGWNDGRGFAPIGAPGAAFTGTLDGRGNAIRALTINRPSAAMFGQTDTATISNLTLDRISVTGPGTIGALAALAVDTGIANVAVTDGTVTAILPGNVGGIIGELRGASAFLRGSSFTGEVSSDAKGGLGYSLGGLVGRNSGTISESSFTGSVGETGVANGPRGVGGAVGTNLGTLSGVATAGDMLLSGVGGALQAGGLVGANLATGTITGSDSVISVTVDDVEADQIIVGGLAGQNIGGITASRSTAPVRVTGTATAIAVGGF